VRGTLDPQDRERALRYLSADPATFREFATERGWASPEEQARTVRQMLAVGLVLGGWFGYLLGLP